MNSIPHSQRVRTQTPANSSGRGSEPRSDAAGDQWCGLHADPRRALPVAQPIPEDQEPNTLLIEDPILAYGFVQLPKLVLYARNLSRDAKLLYAVLLGYAWQERRCFPGYTRLCEDLDASENAVRKYMRELEAVHLLSQRRRGQGLSNVYMLHDLRTAKIEVQEPHKSMVQEPHKPAILEPQESDDYEETGEIKTREKEHRTIGERPVLKMGGNAQNEGRALGGGVPAELATITPASALVPTTLQCDTPTRGKQTKAREAPTPREQKLAQARAVVGAVLEEKLRERGGSNPAGGADTILDALIDVQTPIEVMSAMIEVGERRLEQQQGLTYIPNPTGYLIGIMRNLAVEAWLKGWNLAQIQAEDEEKHAQALRAASCGEPRVVSSEREECPEPEEACPVAGEAACADLSAAADPTAYLPEGVEVANAATVATWHDDVPDAEGSGQPRRVSMLWGFVREAISAHLNLARRSQLQALVPKWDAARPRTLLLLCDTTWDARAAELYLRREIEPQLDKLLSRFFDEMQVVYAPGQEKRA